MAASTKNDRDQGTRLPKQDKPLTSAEQAEFDQLSARLRDTPAGNSDQPYGSPGGSVYDDQQSGIHRGSSRTQTGGQTSSNPHVQRGGFGSTKQDMSPEDIQAQENQGSPKNDQLGRGYTTPDANEEPEPAGNRFQRARRSVTNFAKKRKKTLLIGGGIASLSTSAVLFMLSLLPFQLHHIFQNLDLRIFSRLHGLVTTERSHKWIQAYMTARLMDIDDPANNHKPTDNIMFRAEQVDFNQPFIDWYRTIRTTKFESEMFEQQGIKFTSMAVREGNKYVFRTAKIIINDRVELEFNLRENGIDEATIERAMAGDITAFEEIDRLTGKLDDFIKREVFDSNKTARKEVKDTVKRVMKENDVKWWNAAKRYHIKKDIMNMTGITKFKFFETSREKLSEGIIGARNKMLEKALPSNTKTGKFVECMLGIKACKKPLPDPSHPGNKNIAVFAPDGPDGGLTDANGNPIGDGAGDERLKAGLPGDDVELSDIQKKIASELIKKGGLAVGVLSVLDSIAKFDESMNNRSLSGLVALARSQQVAALWASFEIANDQVYTGELFGEELDDFMGMVANTTNTEAWSLVVEERPNVVHAAEFVAASNKEEYCSVEHQEQIRKPENQKQASNEFVYHCPQDQVGAATAAAALENAWNNGVGAIFHPIGQVIRHSVGVVFDIFGDVVEYVTGPAMDAIIEALGLQDDIKEFTAWLGRKALEFSGAGLMWDQKTLSGRIINLIFQGGAVGAEGSARAQGGAATTPEMETETLKMYDAATTQRLADMSFSERYLSLDNPQSVASGTLFALLDRTPGTVGQSMLGSIGSIFTTPFTFISSTVHAAGNDNPYTASRKLAGIQTFDFPVDECVKRPVIGLPIPKIKEGVWGQNGDGLKDGMTPQNATNADDMGIFKPEELNWDLIRDKDRWYQELYAKLGDDPEGKALQVWNCALLDNTVAGSIGALYGYKGVGAASSSNVIRTYE